ncbi:hypothetical protein G4B88_009485 [Cannabis sativa]|uniref:Uncharacterized protein n=1 Tax=Cannabis sativa TaxID=3483 RepID=A0A7J6EV22_CANSA|nr:hypothetical protein G4B88_009485 [Cannabis sativa]
MDKSMLGGDMPQLSEEDNVRMSTMIDQLQIRDSFDFSLSDDKAQAAQPNPVIALSFFASHASGSCSTRWKGGVLCWVLSFIYAKASPTTTFVKGPNIEKPNNAQLKLKHNKLQVPSKSYSPRKSAILEIQLSSDLDSALTRLWRFASV